MKIARYVHDGEEHLGVVSDDETHVSRFEYPGANGDLVGLIEKIGAGWMPRPAGDPVPVGEVKLLAPISRPRRNVWCVGRNYRAHASELAASVFKDNDSQVAAWPIIFTKAPETVTGPHDDVGLAADVTQSVDYEAELAVVIGTRGKNIPRSDAMHHIFGYTIVNDVTARDVQMRHQQWDLGKSFDGFCPMGPWIVTATDFAPENSRVRCWVNGNVRQDAQVIDLIFDIPTLIETISRGITLYPGDVIATGTPAGVGMGMKPPSFLRAGDVVRIQIDGLGAIENRFI